MNPKSFIIIFMLILAMMLLAAPKELSRSYFTVSTKFDIIIKSELQSAECDRTKILMEELLRNAQEYKYEVECIPDDPDK